MGLMSTVHGVGGLISLCLLQLHMLRRLLSVVMYAYVSFLISCGCRFFTTFQTSLCDIAFPLWLARSSDAPDKLMAGKYFDVLVI